LALGAVESYYSVAAGSKTRSNARLKGRGDAGYVLPYDVEAAIRDAALSNVGK
jgi:hypothetical protein